MPAPEVVVFDLGKVLVDFDYSIAGRKLAAKTGLDMAAVQKILDHSPLLFRYETGLMTSQEFFDEVRKLSGFAGEFHEFSANFADIFSEIPPMIALHTTLREAGIPTYIFSNTNAIAITHIRRRFPFFSRFNGYVLSYEQGAMKPDPRIYESVERMTGRAGAAIAYLDDRAENVATATARGWHGLLHETPERTISALQILGLPVPTF